MMLVLSKEDYLQYFNRVMDRLSKKKEYITALDAATGDGDHWANLYTGFGKLIEAKEQLKNMSLQELLKRSGMILMSGVGGSSGVLYGSAYIGASRVVGMAEEIDLKIWHEMLQAMLEAMMKRGGAKPGHKTMLDALAPAVWTAGKMLEQGADDKIILEAVKKAANDGAEATKDMEAVFGRAVYQADKGIGHLDPGAVTMAYQIEIMADMFLEKDN